MPLTGFESADSISPTMMCLTTSDYPGVELYLRPTKKSKNDILIALPLFCVSSRWDTTVGQCHATNKEAEGSSQQQHYIATKILSYNPAKAVWNEVIIWLVLQST